jgi:phage terminase small subunit
MFVAEFIVDRNGTQAAIRAGYSPKTAEQQASRLLRKVQVKAEIDRRLGKLQQKLEITAERVLEELAKMGFSNMLDYVQVHGPDALIDLSTLTREQAAAIQEITVDEYLEGSGDEARTVKRTRIKLASKRENLELLGKHLKLFTEKVEHTGKDGGPIEVTDARQKLFDKLTSGPVPSPARSRKTKAARKPDGK